MEIQLFVLSATKFMEKKLKMETSCEMPEKSETTCTLKFWNIREDEANDTALVKQQLCDKDMKVPSKLRNSQAYT